MGLSTHKFKESDFSLKKIADLSDTPSSDGMTAAELKARFDDIPKNMIALGNFNNLVDNLVSLNLDNIVGDIDDRYTKQAADDRIAEETNGLIESIEFTKENGQFKITTKGGKVTTIDTDIEKIPAKLELVAVGDKTYLRITNEDGSYTEADVTTLLNVYTFSDSDTIGFAEDPKYQVTAKVNDSSIKKAHLSKDTTDYLEGLEKSAAASANASASSADESEKSAENSSDAAISSMSYAVGGTGARTGEDTDNAKYYSEQSNKDYTAMQTDLTELGKKVPVNGYPTTDTIQWIMTSYGYTGLGKGEYEKGQLLTASALVKSKSITAKHISDDFVTDLLNSTEFTGTPTAPTPDASDSSTRLATTEFVDKYHDSLDLGDFVDADLAKHMADVNAHSSIVIDAMATAATTQDTLDAHKSAEDSHGNLTVDGGDLRDPKKYRNQETLEEHETASYAHSNLVIEGGIV